MTTERYFPDATASQIRDAAYACRMAAEDGPDDVWRTPASISARRETAELGWSWEFSTWSNAASILEAEAELADQETPDNHSPPPMRRPPRLLLLALAVLATHALTPPPARAGFILAPLPAEATSVHFADQIPGVSVVGLDPTSGVGVAVLNNGGDLLEGSAARDAARFFNPTDPAGSLTLIFDRPVYGAAFLFGSSFSFEDLINLSTAVPSSPFSSDLAVGGLHGTPGGRVSILATDGDAFRAVSVSSGSIGGVFGLRILTRPVATPEPAGWLAMGTGGLGLVGVAWRGRRRKDRPAAQPRPDPRRGFPAPAETS